jgi:hypothetical protein
MNVATTGGVPTSNGADMDGAKNVTRAPLSTLERVALLGLVAQQVFVFLVVPASPFAHLDQAVYFATVATTPITVALVVLRFAAKRRIGLEKQLLAAFLAGMPVIYTVAAIQQGASGQVISMEGTAILVFGVFAIVGVIGSPWFLVVGIAAHGVCWDVWHHPTELVVPGWYAVGCFVVDVAMAGWAATQVPVYSSGRSYRHGNVTEGR